MAVAPRQSVGIVVRVYGNGEQQVSTLRWVAQLLRLYVPTNTDLNVDSGRLHSAEGTSTSSTPLRYASFHRRVHSSGITYQTRHLRCVCAFEW